MNWTIKWLDSAEYFRVSLSGTFSLAEVKAAGEEIAESDLHGGDSILVNDTKMDMGDIKGSDVKAMSNMMGQLNEKVGLGKVAVVGSSDLQFGLARQFQILSESQSTAEIRAFRYEASAIEWLGADLPPVNPMIPVSPSFFPLISVM